MGIVFLVNGAIIIFLLRLDLFDCHQIYSVCRMIYYSEWYWTLDSISAQIGYFQKLSSSESDI